MFEVGDKVKSKAGEIMTIKEKFKNNCTNSDYHYHVEENKAAWYGYNIERYREVSATEQSAEDLSCESIENLESKAKQSDIGVSFRDYIARSIERLGKVELEGTKYGRGNWKLMPIDDTMEHAFQHIANAIVYSVDGDLEQMDKELDHAGCRICMAIAKRELEKL